MKNTIEKTALWFGDWLKSMAAGFALFLVIRTILIQTFVITSSSMEGTLLVGDLLILNKAAYGATVPLTGRRLPGYTEPHRGDVVVFLGQHEPLDIIKRLIGLPGDTLQMKGGQLFLNGIAQNEPYIRHTDALGDGTHPWMEWRDNWGPIIIPAHRYFVMGDNRDESLDSRFWGLLDPARVKGKAEVIYYSYERGSLAFIPVLHARWQRIGDIIR